MVVAARRPPDQCRGRAVLTAVVFAFHIDSCSVWLFDTAMTYFGTLGAEARGRLIGAEDRPLFLKIEQELDYGTCPHWRRDSTGS